MSNVRRHKGLEPAEAVSGAGSVAIDGAFEEWQQVLPVFRDPPGDTAHRNFRNTDGSAQLTNSTGRNDHRSAHCP